MSNIGKVPIEIPQGVTATVNSGIIEVKGPKGVLSRPIVKDTEVEIANNIITVKSDNPASKKYFGLMRTLIANMVEGVLNGYTKRLKIVGVGYRAVVEGSDLTLSIGFSHPVKITSPEGIEINTEKNNIIVVNGINKELVGKVASEIRALKKPEPYKGKGIMYEGETVRRKAGKSLKGAEGAEKK